MTDPHDDPLPLEEAVALNVYRNVLEAYGADHLTLASFDALVEAIRAARRVQRDYRTVATPPAGR